MLALFRTLNRQGWLKEDEMNQSLEHLSHKLQAEKGLIKFEIISFIVDAITQGLGTKSTSPVKWPARIRSEIVEIFRNKLSDTHRRLVLVASSVLISAFGPDWFFDINDSSLSRDKFLQLFVHIVSAEIRVLLDDDTILTKTVVSEIDGLEIPSLNDVLVMCLDTLYSSVYYISTASEDIDFDSVLSIRTALSEAMVAVFSFLEDQWVSSTL